MPEMDTIMRDCLAGRKITECKVIDFHAHIGDFPLMRMMNHTPEEIVKTMDSIGIDVACVNNCVDTDYVRGNNLVLESVKSFPDRFVGFCHIVPDQKEKIMGELNRCFRAGMKGIKIHQELHYPSVSLSDERYKPVWEFASEIKCPVLVHSAGNLLEGFSIVAKKYPLIPIVHAHSIGRIESPDVELRYPNIYIDTACTWTKMEAIEDAVRLFRTDRVLFGTDMPLNQPGARIGAVCTADITKNEKEMILGGNALSLLAI